MDGGVKVTPCTLQIPQCFCPEEYTFAVDALDMVPELVRALPDTGPSSATPKATRQQRRRMGTAFRPASPEWILSPARCLGAGQVGDLAGRAAVSCDGPHAEPPSDTAA
ncbi:uncharacterized protein PADG_11831 [Paracoccidioides brasiliensis Pb18]|uniref:Uncharacterized protein n=1 Tax=Paracoccidioides brasiliensis (strain Pb18) TaxID=502780 RepID=A0A0A0HX97_PARBD|nr:uncharacterized protein PADG_11831 [Paracoccidioides brasiliensis Pb18]KGM92040.1 hypothetical protein PADG_11831 [Paracoccidioides brasiliensis Pb18]